MDMSLFTVVGATGESLLSTDMISGFETGFANLMETFKAVLIVGIPTALGLVVLGKSADFLIKWAGKILNKA